jgi:hypothetical protein
MSGLYDLVVAGNDRGRLELLAAVDHEGEEVPQQVVWHSWRDPSHGWGNWESLGEPPGGGDSRLAVAANADGRFEAVVVGVDSAVWHIWADRCRRLEEGLAFAREAG